MTVEVSGTTVNVDHGKLNISESEQNNVSFYCKASTEMSAFDWIKDGVYINIRGNIIYPARTVDLSKLSNSYSTQGTYWCEAWIPGCTKKYHSNKINLKFIGVTTIHLNLKKEEITKLNTMDILRKLKTLIPLHARGNILDFDVRRGYTSIAKQSVSTYNFNVYVDDKVSNFLYKYKLNSSLCVFHITCHIRMKYKKLSSVAACQLFLETSQLN